MRRTARNEALVLLPAVCWMLGAGAASAQTYRVLEGALTDAQTGESTALGGGLEASLVEQSEPSPVVLLFDDFELVAGDEILTPRSPIGYDGLEPIPFVSVADHIQIEGDAVGFLRLHAGGELVAVDDDEVTFRTLELRADGADGGRAIGRIGDGPQPRRLELQGSLFQVDQSFLLPESCRPVLDEPPQQVEPPTGGGVIGGGTVIAYDGLDVREEAPTPTLEELGVTAPAGADVSFAEGSLAITSGGDLLIAGGSWDLPGLVSVSISTPGSITVDGELLLPPDVSLTLEAGAVVIGDDGGIVTPPGDIVVEPPPFPFPCGLRPLPPEETLAGSFYLVATAAQPVDVDVLPWRRHDRIRPGSRGPVPVALLGSEELDVRDVDRSSLRLGPGEAAPLFGRAWRVDVNRDRRKDLVALFRVRDAEIAFGDERVCLTAKTKAGDALEGCDAIDTKPRHRHRHRHHR